MNNIFCRKPKSRSDESFSHFRRTDIFPAPGKKLLIACRLVDCSITAVSDCRHTICRIDNGLCGHLRDVISNYLKWHFSSSLQASDLSALLYHKWNALPGAFLCNRERSFLLHKKIRPKSDFSIIAELSSGCCLFIQHFPSLFRDLHRDSAKFSASRLGEQADVGSAG